MPAPHLIRLQGPWQVVPPGSDRHAPLAEVRIPSPWLECFGESAGTAIFLRTFNLPTNLQPEDRILLQLPPQTGLIEACLLNGEQLEPLAGDPPAYDITLQLREFNRLEIHIQFNPAAAPQTPGGLWQPVLLQIHAAQ